MGERTKLLEEICKQFDKEGVKATLLDFYSPEAIGGKITYLYAAYDPYEGILHLGSIDITGRDIDQVQVFTRMIPSDISGFRWYDVHFLVKEEPKGKEKMLTVDSKESHKESHWKGGGLADLLNKDAELQNMFLKVKSPHRIRPDNQYGCVRIIVRMSREESGNLELLVSKTAECFDACDRIAKHIRSITREDKG